MDFSIDIPSLLTYLSHVNPLYAVGLGALLYLFKTGKIGLPSIPGITLKEDALSARVKAKAAAKYKELVSSGKDEDEAHGALVAAIKAVK